MTDNSGRAGRPGETEVTRRLARLLIESRERGPALDPGRLVEEGLEPASDVEANRVDDLVAELSGRPVQGWKIGCTSEHAQRLLNATGPFAGRVYTVLKTAPASHPSSSGGPEPVAIAEPFAVEPLLEGEFAFTFGADLPPTGEPRDRAAVVEAVATVHPAIEFVGGRYQVFLGAPLRLIIADAGANIMLVLGPEVPLDTGLADRLDGLEATMTVDGEVTGSGRGADVLGHPVDALVWLVNHLAGRGIGVDAGQTVTTGTATQVSSLPAGSQARFEIEELGSVAVDRADAAG
jgi:2-keto-4-pentenoate hydratase